MNVDQCAVDEGLILTTAATKPTSFPESLTLTKLRRKQVLRWITGLKPANCSQSDLARWGL